MDAPILGHGSWAEDPKYSEMLTDLLMQSGYKDDGPASDDRESFLIPCHSHLMAAWVFSGLAGAIFWLYAYYLVLRFGLYLITQHPPLAPYYAYLVVAALWDILFSPFGLNRRIEVSFLLVVICTLLEKAPKLNAQPVPSAWRGSSLPGSLLVGLESKYRRDSNQNVWNNIGELHCHGRNSIGHETFTEREIVIASEGLNVFHKVR